ncbi:MAG TPA: GFA family protein [Stellaceae bacterium]|nr:GFA family protein [Stellaceae bacterium]
MPQITGGCRCGQVRYSANAEPAFTGVCHCTNCQKESGTAFSVVIAVPQAALAIQGSPKSYTSKGDSGKAVVAKFCPNCGSTLLSEPELMPGMSIVRAGTLDDTSWLKPTMEIYCDSKQPWVELGGGLQSFPKMPGPG